MVNFFECVELGASIMLSMPRVAKKLLQLSSANSKVEAIMESIGLNLLKHSCTRADVRRLAA